MARANVEGIQSEGVVACAKHFLDNNQEGPSHNGRLKLSAVVPERAQHELFVSEELLCAGARAGVFFFGVKRSGQRVFLTCALVLGEGTCRLSRGQWMAVSGHSCARTTSSTEPMRVKTERHWAS